MLKVKSLFCAVVLLSAFCGTSRAYDPKARQIKTDVSNFNNNLSSSDTDLQKALETLDNMSGGGGVAWGAITGTLSNQTDLNTALSGKVATSVTVNGHALTSNVTVTPSDLSLVIGTNVQAYDADLTTYAGITPSANVQTLLGAADFAAFRSSLSLVIGTNVQAYDSDLTTFAGITPSANIQTFLGSSDYAAARTNLGLAIGTNVQAFDSDLSTWAGLTPSSFFQTLVDDTDAAAVRSTLSLGSFATTSGNYVKDVADGTGIDGTATAEGATYTPSLDLTEVTNITWSDGVSGSIAHTYNVSGTDVVATYGNAAVSYGTGVSVALGSVEVGHATDSTISRSSAGVLAVEGVVIDTVSAANTLTNKRITPRVVTAADATSITPNTDSADVTYQANTQSSGTLTINADSGTPANGQRWILKIKSTNVQTYSWNSVFASSPGVTLPTASSGGSAYNYVGFIYNTDRSKWDCVASV